MTKMRSILVVLAVLVGILSLWCGGSTLYVAKISDAVSLDPHDASAGPSMEVYVNIYESLTRVDTDGSLKPWLATSWETIAPDRVRFHLRENVQFHDGTLFTAAAVKYAIERTLDPENPARVANQIQPVSGAEVLDDYTVDVYTSAPFGPIPTAMSYFIALGIPSPTAVEKYGDDYGRHPIGTGPFRFVEWVPNERIVLERFPEYWGESAKLDSIQYQVIPDLQAQHFALEKGEIDVLLSPEPARIAMYKESPDYIVYETAGLRVMQFGCDTTAGPTASKTIRKAISYAMDKNLLIEAILEGNAVPARSFMASGSFGFSDVNLPGRYPHDPARARELLSQEGWEDRNGDGLVENEQGETLTLTIYAPEGRYIKDRETAIAVHYMLKEAGFDAELIIDPWGTYIGTLGKPTIEMGHEKYDLHLVGFSSGPDAVQILEMLYHSSKKPPASCCNWAYYENSVIDDALVKARASGNPQERAELYAEVQQLLADELPTIPYAILTEVVVTGSSVSGYQAHPLDFFKGYFGSVSKE